MVVFDDGLVGEVQMYSRPMYEAKASRGAELYTRWRSEKDAHARAALKAEQIKLHSAAMAASDPSFASRLGGSSSPNRVVNRARQRDSVINPAVEATSKKSTLTQGPNGSSRANADSVGELRTAGRSSQLTNFIEDPQSSGGGSVNAPKTNIDPAAAAGKDPLDISETGDFDIPVDGGTARASAVIEDLKTSEDSNSRIDLCGPKKGSP